MSEAMKIRLREKVAATKILVQTGKDRERQMAPVLLLPCSSCSCPFYCFFRQIFCTL